MLTCLQWWKDHNLSLTLIGLGLMCYAIGGCMAWLTDWVRWSDFFLNLGHGFVPVGLYGLLMGPLVERNKPDEEPPPA